MSYYYGNSGPAFLLQKEDGSKYQKYNLPAPQVWSEDPWITMQNQQRDVNNIIRMDSLKYRYEQTMEWRPADDTGNTNMQYLITISNWLIGGNSKRRLVFYPHSDILYVYFNVVLAKATPFLFTKVPYNGFKMHVISKDVFDKIPDPDGLIAVDFGQDYIIVDDGGNSSTGYY